MMRLPTADPRTQTTASSGQERLARRAVLGRARKTRKRHRGLTLIELIVVMLVLTILVAATVPMMVPAIQQRKTRETARIVQAALNVARNRAIETGRPAGVTFQRLANEDSASILLFHAEVPPAYSGDFTTSGVKMSDSGGAGAQQQFTAEFTEALPPNPPNFIRDGDLLRVNYQGPIYRLQNPGSTSSVMVSLDNKDISDLPWSNDPSAVLPYQIFRQPVRSPAPPVQLPSGIAIDLSQSGQGSDGVFSSGGATGPGQTGQDSISIMFAPDGSIDRIYGVDASQRIPAETIHLLIGKLDQIGERNLSKENLTNLWISISRQSGLVVSEPMAAPPAAGGGASLQNARKFAQKRQTIGGG